MSKITWLFPSGSTVRLRQSTGGFVEIIALAQEKNWIKSKTVLIYG